MLGAIRLQGAVDLVGEPEQGQFPQRGEVSEPKVVGEGRVDSRSRVHVALGEAVAQRLRGEVDNLDLVGAPEHPIGNGLPLGNTGDLFHHIIEGLDVLHVDGRDHGDTRVAKRLDVLPAFGVE